MLNLIVIHKICLCTPILYDLKHNRVFKMLHGIYEAPKHVLMDNNCTCHLKEKGNKCFSTIHCSMYVQEESQPSPDSGFFLDKPVFWRIKQCAILWSPCLLIYPGEVRWTHGELVNRCCCPSPEENMSSRQVSFMEFYLQSFNLDITPEMWQANK